MRRIILSSVGCLAVEYVWNMMAQAQKPDFVFRRNGRAHLNRKGASVQSTTVSRGVHISCSNAGYTMFRGSVKSTDTNSIRQFSPHFPSLRHRVPSHFNWNLPRCCSTFCYMNGTIFVKKNLLNTKYVFWSSLQILSEIFHSLWRMRKTQKFTSILVNLH